MKKALLTLTMVCALPISSLNAGWSDWIPSWRAEPVSSGVPEFPASASNLYKQAAQPVINLISPIRTEEKRQSLVESAKKWSAGAATSLGVLLMGALFKYRRSYPGGPVRWKDLATSYGVLGAQAIPLGAQVFPRLRQVQGDAICHSSFSNCWSCMCYEGRL